VDVDGSSNWAIYTATLDDVTNITTTAPTHHLIVSRECMGWKAFEGRASFLYLASGS